MHFAQTRARSGSFNLFAPQAGPTIAILKAAGPGGRARLQAKARMASRHFLRANSKIEAGLKGKREFTVIFDKQLVLIGSQKMHLTYMLKGGRGGSGLEKVCFIF